MKHICMINLFILIASLIAETSWANNDTHHVYMRKDGLSQENFNAAVKSLNGISIVDFVRKKYSFQDLEHLNIPTTEIEIRDLIEKFENRPMLKGDAEFLLGLYHKLSSMNDAQVPLSRIAGLFVTYPEFQDYYFDYWDQLKNKIHPTLLAKNQLLQLRNLLNDEQVLLVDGKILSLENIEALSNLPHQWLFISNVQLPILYHGTVDGFLQQSIQPKMPQATCLGESVPFNSLPNFKLTLITEEPSCLALLSKETSIFIGQSSEKQSFYEENKTIIFATGIVIGAITLVAMKDKKLSIKFPSFNF